jgi:hypothetical protein
MKVLEPSFMLDVREADITGKVTEISDICCADHTMKSVEVQGGYKIKQGDPSCTPHFGCRMFFGVEGFIPTVFRNCSHNEKVSMDGRVGKKLPMHDSDEVSAAVLDHWKVITFGLLPFLLSHIARVFMPVPFADWLKSFVPRRRDALNKVVRDCHDMPKLVASSFIKKELAIKDKSDVVFKDPRFIQGCPLELSAKTGPYIRVFAKHMREGLRPKNWLSGDLVVGKQVIYTCGLTSEEIGENFAKATLLISELCGDEEKVVYLEDDQSRFDLHLTEGPFWFLDRLYSRVLPRKVRHLLRRRKSSGVTGLGTKYSVPFTMQSGWPDTSAGDTAVNILMKFHIHGVGRKWISIVCGDDSVTVTTDKELARIGGLNGIIRSYAAFGMEVEATSTSDPLLVGFCSGRFMPHGESYILVPRVGRMLGKLGWDMVNRSPRNQLSWLRGIAETLKHYGLVDPLLAALGNSLSMICGEGYVIREVITEYKHRYGSVGNVARSDILTYYDTHYGVDAATVDRLVALMNSVTIGKMFVDETLRAIVAKDI